MNTSISQTRSMPILNKFKETIKNLDGLYGQKRDQLSDEWISFNESVAESIVLLYASLMCLDIEVQKHYNDTDQKVKISRFLSFYFDFIVSKPSSSIFTETQKESLQDLFPISSYSVVQAVEDFYNYIYSVPENHELHSQFEFQYKLQKLFHKAFSFYDFIFTDDRGVFTKFSYKKDFFIAYKQSVEVLLGNHENTFDGIRKVANKIIIYNIAQNIYFEETNKIVEFTIDNLELEFNNIYKKFIDKSLEEKKEGNYFRLEIFSYILANKVWKIDKIYQKQYEYLDEEEERKANNIYEKKLKNFILRSLEEIYLFYNGEIDEKVLYYRLGEVDNEFIDKYILCDILGEIQNCEQSSSGAIKNDLLKLVPKKDYYSSANNMYYIDSKLISDYAINNTEYEKFKFYRVIAKADSQKIAKVIHAMHMKVDSYVKENSAISWNNIYYIGILRSGSFLAHSLNIMKYYESDSKNNIFADSLLNHPYLTIVPRTLYNRKEDKEKLTVVYIDEAIKSGYGVTVSHLYRKKILKRCGFDITGNDFVLTVADFIDYRNKINKKIDMFSCAGYSKRLVEKPLWATSLFQCQRNKNDLDQYELDSIESKVAYEKEFEWKKFIEDIGYIDQSTLKDYARISLNGSKDQYDITKLVSNSFFLFMISKYFAEQIKDRYSDKEKYIFYAGSVEGKLLIDTTVFIYKVLYPEESQGKTFYINGKTFSGNADNREALLFFDLTYISGRTCKQVFELDVCSLLKSAHSDFDEKFVIFSHSKKIISYQWNGDINNAY